MTSTQVITPFGSFTATWPDDEDRRVQYFGSFDAICYFRSYLESELVSGLDGRRLNFETLEPNELIGFCQDEEKGLFVEQDMDQVGGE